MNKEKANIVLIHGWGYANYNNQTKSTDVWRNRRAFVDKLSECFNVSIITLPGFCGQPEPNKPWQLENFVDFMESELKNKDIKPDFVLGYSFGAPVALRHKLKYGGNQKMIFVSPAIARKYKENAPAHNKLKYFTKVLPDVLQRFLQDQYISKVIKNPFYAKGNNFIKQTYLNIVGLDLSDDLLKLKKDGFILIFGENDTATPANVLLSKQPTLKSKTLILKSGTHDIANTNTDELVDAIEKFIKKNSLTFKDRRSEIQR